MRELALAGPLLVTVFLQLASILCESHAPCVCPEIGKPVRGPDNNTYSNECMLKCTSNNNVKNNQGSQGKCPDPSLKQNQDQDKSVKEECICTSRYDPVYDTDGKRYGNSCELECAKRKRNQQDQRIKNKSIQDDKDKPTQDDKNQSTQDDKDQATQDDKWQEKHDNKDQSTQDDKDQSTQDYKDQSTPDDKDQATPDDKDQATQDDKDQATQDGKCQEKHDNQKEIVDKGCFCTDQYDPLCASDNKTYSNACQLGCENIKRKELHLEPLTRVSDGECSESCVCTEEYKPLCGTDGKLYENPCKLDCEIKRRERLGLDPIAATGNYQCVQVDCVCTREYNPLCGNDGTTYSNPCVFKCENQRRKKIGLKTISKKYDGECENCICTLEYAPVCGSNGKTYATKCVLECENKERKRGGKHPIKIKYNGECKPGKSEENDESDKQEEKENIDEGCLCTDQYDPLCASDNKTYSNSCQLGCENMKRKKLHLEPLTRVSDGECSESCVCTEEYKPLCGTDGKLYENPCKLDCEIKRRERLGLDPIAATGNYQCVQVDCVCTREYNPLCGNDGTTYSNPCVFKCENQRRKKIGLKTISKKYDGECENCICTLEYAPVCGSNGKTYATKCVLECENKERKRGGKHPIKIKYNGECKPGKSEENDESDKQEEKENIDEGCLCTDQYDPLCASDNKTYSNSCQLGCENMKRKKLHLEPLTRVSDGECSESCVCTEEYKPLCGTDGKLYENPCKLDCEIKRRERLGLDPIAATGNYQCVQVDCVCTREYNPLCGNDGTTYSNPCVFKCENQRRKKIGLKTISKKYDGECENCICTLEYAPVCGSNGKTYATKCVLECENKERKRGGKHPIKIKYNGECKPGKSEENDESDKQEEKENIDEGCLCTDQYDPLCASDNKTYSNSCQLGCENMKRKKLHLEPLTRVSDGECSESCVCTEEYKPLCGTDGKLYENPCKLDCEIKRRERLELDPIAATGNYQCVQVDCVCTREYNPLCGNDGTTYSNPCVFKCENQRRKKIGLKTISKKYDGECKNCICTLEYAPVCGSNGKTYATKCVLECENKERKRGGKHPIKIKYNGECKPGKSEENDESDKQEEKENIDEGCLCTDQYDPLCASDNKTYSNSCQLGCENMKRKKLHLEPLTRVSDGECSESCVCTEEYKPLCGTDGKLYENPCKLDCEIKRRERLGLDPIAATGNYQCVQVDCVCTREYNPLCGNDGTTYSNPCVFKCENQRRKKIGLKTISKKYDGECENCICTLEYAPVCGSNGKTYATKCVLECENKERKRGGKHPIKIKYNGECKPGKSEENDESDKQEEKENIDEGCLCTDQYDPLCASDNKTYSNACQLGCENIKRKELHLEPLTRVSDGECSESCVCTEEYKPLCGTDGKLYENPCKLDCEIKRRERLGLDPIAATGNYQCVQVDCVCTREYNPLCGNDGTTYSNPCVFKCENQRRKKIGLKTISKKYDGECENCICTLEYAPVCGSNGKTYATKCVLECENKERKRGGKHPIKIKYNGECKPGKSEENDESDKQEEKENIDEGCLCTDQYDPLCASDNKTYSNSCQLGCENMKRKKLHLELLTRVSDGECSESCVCTEEYKPLCGTDGKLYENPCKLDCEIKRRERLELDPIAATGNYQCVQVDCVCTREYNPLCGNDGTTYSNPCVFKCENQRRKKIGLKTISKKYDGECKNCICTLEYAPVCGSNGKTYATKCVLECENKERKRGGKHPIKIKYNGECKPGKSEENDESDKQEEKENIDEGCLCTDQYDPLCASDNKTYSNSCQLGCENMKRKKLHLEPLTRVSDGECSESCVCTEEYKPLCGTDGKLYENPCKLDCEIKRRERLGLDPIAATGNYQCVQVDCVCTREYNPLCGNDGTTYSNPCVFKCENQRRKKIGLKTISKKYDGECENCICTLEYAPVCGSNGKTYATKCVLECENKERKRSGKHPIKIKYNGECKPGKSEENDESDKQEEKENIDEGCLCTDQYDPLCASDNKTYSNSCQLGCENMKRKKLHLEPLTRVSDGECSESCVCTEEYKPLCGTDGKLYENPCKLDCEIKRRERLGLDPIAATGNYQCVQVDCVCTREYNPLCGNDGTTYSNPCVFKCENQRRKKIGLKTISKKYDGECENCICTLEYAPVCGSNGKTYATKCVLECENKERKRGGKPPIKIKYNGECKPGISEENDKCDKQEEKGLEIIQLKTGVTKPI